MVPKLLPVSILDGFVLLITPPLNKINSFASPQFVQPCGQHSCLVSLKQKKYFRSYNNSVYSGLTLTRISSGNFGTESVWPNRVKLVGCRIRYWKLRDANICHVGMNLLRRLKLGDFLERSKKGIYLIATNMSILSAVGIVMAARHCTVKMLLRIYMVWVGLWLLTFEKILFSILILCI